MFLHLKVIGMVLFITIWHPRDYADATSDPVVLDFVSGTIRRETTEAATPTVAHTVTSVLGDDNKGNAPLKGYTMA